MKTTVLFDVDGTLTPPRQPITSEMVEILNSLCIPFAVAAGSHLPLLKKQFFEPMFENGFRKQFQAFVSNGAIQYLCDYSNEMLITLVNSFDIKNFLGDADYQFLIEILEKTHTIPEFSLPPSLKVVGDIIVYRESMVNFAPIGRLKEEGPEAQQNRANFVNFDKTYGYRDKVMAHLNRELSNLIKGKGLKITLGGQTSFDIGISGKDKTNAVTTLFELGFDHVVFMGDALFEDGNDYAIKELERDWPSDSPKKIEAVQVESFKDTIKKLNHFEFLNQ